MARERIAQSDIRRSVLDRAVAPNLDLSRHPLIGRRRELVELESELRSARLISLTGLGGIGKSYLAREAARRWSLTERPATWVDLATLHDITELPGALAMSTSLRGAIDSDLRGALAEQLERHPSLLVLDNLEHLRQAGSLVGWLLDHTTRLRILATSRVRVGIPGEVEIRLQPLAVPRSPADLAHSPAAQLFMGRADRHRDLAQLAPEDAAAIVLICRRLDGLPLALELAAGWAGLLSPRAILRRLENGRLSLGIDDDPRHASYEAIVEATLDLVPPADRDAFDALAVFAGGFDEDAVRAIADVADGLPVLRRLQEVGLVRADDLPDGEPRFSLLEVIRGVADLRLTRRSKRATVSDRHAAYFAALAGGAGSAIRDGSPGLALGWIGTEWANLQAAARQAMASGRADDAVRLAGAMGEYVRPCGGSVHEAEARLTAALALDGLAPDVHCEALCTLAWLEAQLGDDDALRAATTDAMATADRIGDARLQTLTLVTRAALAGGPQAGAQLGRAIELASASGATGLRIRALANLATFEGNRGHYAAALDHFTQARRAAEAEGSTLIATHTLANMSQCLLQLGRPDAAIELLEEAIPRLRRVAGGPSMLAWCLGMLAVAESLSGRPRGAHGHLIESARLTIEADTAETMAEYLQAAAISLAEDHPREAAAALGAFTSIRPGSERSGSLEVRPLIGSTEQRLIRTLGAAASAVIRRRGEATPPRDVVHGLLQLLESHDPATHVRLRGRFGTFTARERDVITRLAQGMSDSEISRELFISPKTVSVHVANIKAKFGVSTRVEAALQAQAAVGTADTPPV